MRSKYAVCLAALIMSGAAPAQAAWHRASSAHFIIYADQPPAKLRDFAVKLERFDKAVRIARSMHDVPIGDGNRLTVFVVSNPRAVQKLARDKTGFVAGFYIPRASGSVAFVPRSAGDGSQTDLNADTIFFHEYAHHLMMQELDRPLPEWLIEGFAEFLSTARFEADGTVGLGAAAVHRAQTLFSADRLTIDVMLAGNHGRLDENQRESLYGRGWLLTHYLTFEPSRHGQLELYLDGIARGGNPLDAARSAFGDLKVLDKDINAYLMRRRLAYLPISASRIHVGAIDIVPLTPGAAAVIPLRMRSKRGVNAQTSGPLAEEVRRIAKLFPGDPLVEVTLSEAEVDAGNFAAAEAAADRALLADPKMIEAMIYKGRAMMARAQDSRTKGDWAAARNWFIAANKADSEDPEPLMLFYESYIRAGERPNANAIAALHYASNLAPQDTGLRLNSAMQYLRDQKPKEAKAALAPLAYNPHGRELAEMVRGAIKRIDAADPAAALATLGKGAGADPDASP